VQTASLCHRTELRAFNSGNNLPVKLERPHPVSQEHSKAWDHFADIDAQR
jgi:hypothetical protein